VLALDRHELGEQREYSEDRAEDDDNEDDEAALPLQRRLPLDALDLGARHLDGDKREIEPPARVPAGKNARDKILDRHEQEDGYADSESDEKTDLRAEMARDPRPLPQILLSRLGRFALLPYITDPFVSDSSFVEHMIGRKVQVNHDPLKPEVWFIADKLIEGCKVEQKFSGNWIDYSPPD